MSNEFEVKHEFDGRIYLLKILASFIKPNEKNEMGITLNVHGTIVSGMMIGMKPFYEKFGKSLVESVKDPTSDDPNVSKKALTVIFDDIQEQAALEQQSENGIEFNHIFLRNAKIYNGAQVIPGAGTMFWVGKLESVDGFFLGMIHPLEV